jgi:hypothetical protein
LKIKHHLAVILLLILSPATGFAQSKSHPSDKFRQLDEILPTPNIYRTASGAPGSRYWQQRVDYVIDVELDDANQRISGSEKITYHNLSPDTLTYLWLQLDQNIYAKDATGLTTRTAPDFQKLPFETIDDYLLRQEFDGGYKIAAVRAASGAPLPHTINRTVMRVDLPTPLASGATVVFSVDWSYQINDARRLNGRTGYEHFPRDGNNIYTIAQWFPRLAAYYDQQGWQIKEYLGTGEFALEYGDYKVSITVPEDHIVAATGLLQNPAQVLTRTERERLEQARTANHPVLIVTPDEARANESHTPNGKKTWVFAAENVRDFAFASSRKFIWDAQQTNVEGNPVMAMSFYPKEGNPLWGQYSTAAIMHTLNVYSRHTFPYPYPVAISVNGPVGGMEYPMISFNGPRPEADGTYSAEKKFSLISVVIHEVGHNFFPMLINSDERLWAWMDEGFNTFFEYLAEQEWERDYPSRRGEPKSIAAYMAGEDQVPIMTNPDSVINLGNNAYGKTAAALNILRETVLGRELFDYAFKEYARRWKFKRPTPADFFRTMEDASGVDLDWFWRGWFYTTDHTDISIESVRLYTIDTRNPEVEKERARRARAAQPETLSQQRNRNAPKLVDQNPSLRDFYNAYDEFKVTEREREEFQKYLATLTDRERELLSSGLNFYVINLKNVGGLVMPVILQVDYVDGTTEELRIPAEIWRQNNFEVSKLIITKKEIKAITLDPHLETADADVENNYFPRRPVKSKFQIYKEPPPAPNPMEELERKTPESQKQP